MDGAVVVVVVGGCLRLWWVVFKFFIPFGAIVHTIRLNTYIYIYMGWAVSWSVAFSHSLLHPLPLIEFPFFFLLRPFERSPSLFSCDDEAVAERYIH